MKYPREYSKKAMNVLKKHYFVGKGGASNMELMTLAAHCINLVSMNSPSFGKSHVSFEQVQEVLEEPEPYTN